MEIAAKVAETLADWSKWLVTLQTAAIGAAPYFVRKRKDQALSLEAVSGPLRVALVSFFISVAAGTIVLGNIPLALTAIANDPSTAVDIHGSPAVPFACVGARIWWFAGIEHLCFLLGALLVVVSVIQGDK